MHIYLGADDGSRILACEEVRAHLRFGFRSARTGGAAALPESQCGLIGGDGGERGREGGQLQCGSRPELSLQ